jgi:hypothetical protein
MQSLYLKMLPRYQERKADKQGGPDVYNGTFLDGPPHIGTPGGAFFR